MTRSRFILPLGLLTAVLATSTSAIFIRFAQADAPSLVIAALRLTFASVMLAPLAWFRYRDELRALTKNDLLPGALAGLFLSVHFAAWITSLEYTTVASSVVFVTTGPLWVALVSPWVLKERLARGAVTGLALAFLGGTAIGLSDACTWSVPLDCSSFSKVFQGRAMWGNFLALAGAWAVSGYMIIGRKLRARLSLVAYIFIVYGTAAIALVAVMFAAGQSPFGYPPAAYGWILLTALVPQLIGHSAYNWALGFLPASLVATTTLGEPVAAALLAYNIFDEHPSAPVILGGALILTGIYLVSRNRGTTRRPEKDGPDENVREETPGAPAD
jgi:drug/metabolite transporter (DMT)-like permease